MLSDLRKKKMSQLFDMYDVNKNGFLEASDYERVAENLAKARGIAPGSPGHTGLREKFLALWQQAQKYTDQARPDRLTRDDWIASRDVLLSDRDAFKATIVSACEAFFRMLDADNDGRIDLGEYRLFFDIYEVNGARADEAFGVLDQDRDGYLDRANVEALIEEYFFSDDPAAAGNRLFG